MLTDSLGIEQKVWQTPSKSLNCWDFANLLLLLEIDQHRICTLSPKKSKWNCRDEALFSHRQYAKMGVSSLCVCYSPGRRVQYWTWALEQTRNTGQWTKVIPPRLQHRRRRSWEQQVWELNRRTKALHRREKRSPRQWVQGIVVHCE